MIILGFPDYEPQARRLSEHLGVSYASVGLHRFPDGESRVALPTSLPGHVVFCRSLNQPNEKLIELLLAAKTARQLGANKLTLVAPYLCYMRQDKAFQAGEAVSQQIIGQWLADLFDEVVVVDPHLHRTPSISLAVPAKWSVALSASGVIGNFLAGRTPEAFILGPDEESLQWVQAVAAPGGFDFAVCDKRRTGDREVQVSLPEISLLGRPVVLVDDMASTGQTVVAAASQCLDAGASRVDIFVSHALFVDGATVRMKMAGVSQIWSTDSISHQGNVVHLAPLLAEAIRR